VRRRRAWRHDASLEQEGLLRLRRVGEAIGEASDQGQCVGLVAVVGRLLGLAEQGGGRGRPEVDARAGNQEDERDEQGQRTAVSSPRVVERSESFQQVASIRCQLRDRLLEELGRFPIGLAPAALACQDPPHGLGVLEELRALLALDERPGAQEVGRHVRRMRRLQALE